MGELDLSILSALYSENHQEVLDAIRKEELRQRNTVELIASENFPSDAVRAAVASCFTAKYCEGYPNARYYGGCECADELEEYCRKRWQDAFNTYYHVNVQPHSGSQANAAAYMAVLKPGDTVLAMKLENGGHLTHGSSVNFSGKIYNFVFYGVNDDGFIDYDDLARKIYRYQPKLVLAGASAYSRKIDFKHIYEIICDAAAHIGKVAKDTPWSADIGRPYFMVDMAHVAGLIVAGDHPSPFGYADIVTTTTHKTLRGTRGGLIFCRPELAKKVDSAVFPGTQGGPLMHVIAGKAVTADEACTEAFRSYIHSVVANTKAMCQEFVDLGYDIVTGGTDNHLFLIDFSKTHPHLTGKMVQDELDRHGITLNKNCVPGDRRGPVQTSGVRIGCAAMTTKGYTEDDFRRVARQINTIVSNMKGAE